MATAGRLIFKRGGDVKFVVDPSGNVLAKGRRVDPSDGHGGLRFASSSRTAPAVSIKSSSDRKRDGAIVADSSQSHVTPGGATNPELLFSRNGIARAAFGYGPRDSQAGRIEARLEFVDRFAVRKNVAQVKSIERDNLRDAIVAIDQRFYGDGVSYWDKQDQIHQATHVHHGPAFVPWHRELIGRFEALLREFDPTVSLHYWDWTIDPRSSPDGEGGTVNLFDAAFMGSSSGRAGPPLDTLDNGGIFAGSRNETGNPADPPQEITRDLSGGAPSVDSDNGIVTTGDSDPEQDQWPQFRLALESSHDTAHTYFGSTSTIGQVHSAFEDPFVYILHSNVDRLWARWQLAPGLAWRLDPSSVYGTETDHVRITEDMEPWAGAAGVRPWAPPENQQLVKNCRDQSVVTPPLYDTNP
jgi:hypothetical protein